MKTISFWSFNRKETGRIVTSAGDYVVAQARNPYGGHNLVVVSIDGTGAAEAFRHGSTQTALFAKIWMGEKAYRKVRAHLAGRGIGLTWVVE